MPYIIIMKDNETINGYTLLIPLINMEVGSIGNGLIKGLGEQDNCFSIIGSWRHFSIIWYARHYRGWDSEFGFEED